MQIYDTLLIGSGYGSIGYATAHPNCIICEERQICDTGFYLPMRGFGYSPYTPKTKAGIELQEIFNSFALFDDKGQNVNGFESALCQYVGERRLNVLLKCRVLSATKREDGNFDVRIQTNAGISHLFAKRILNAVSVFKQRRLTVLFTATDLRSAKEELCAQFPGATVEAAFFDGRYALHFPVEERYDENTVKLAVYEKWQRLRADAKIVYIAPVFFGNDGFDGQDSLNDMRYPNPIQAFEAGYFYSAKEVL